MERKNIYKPASGRILISAPFLNDFYFGRSVVILADHSPEGSFGIILNKPLEVKLNEVVPEFPDFEAPVFLGGPVKPDNLYFIHTLGDKIEESTKIMNGLYWGGNIDVVKDMITTGKINLRQIRFFIGYSGWGPGQLISELEEFSWVLSKEATSKLLKFGPEEMWPSLVRQLGQEYAEWLCYPADPSLN